MIKLNLSRDPVEVADDYVPSSSLVVRLLDVCPFCPQAQYVV